MGHILAHCLEEEPHELWNGLRRTWLSSKLNQPSAIMGHCSWGVVSDPLNQDLNMKKLCSQTTHKMRSKEAEVARFAVFTGTPLGNFMLSIPAVLASVELEVQVCSKPSQEHSECPREPQLCPGTSRHQAVTWLSLLIW